MDIGRLLKFPSYVINMSFSFSSILQSLAVVTLGDKQMAQRIDNLVGVDEWKRFYLQVSLSPSMCVCDGHLRIPKFASGTHSSHVYVFVYKFTHFLSTLFYSLLVNSCFVSNNMCVFVSC